MSDRANATTPASLRPTRYSDLDVSFALNPVTGSVSRVVDEAAVAQAIRMTLLTSNEEWPFEPDNGTMIASSLLEPADPVSLDVMRESIATAVRNRCSKYAEIIGIQVRARGAGIDNKRSVVIGDTRQVDVLVAYRMRGSNSIGTVSTTLKLVRR